MRPCKEFHCKLRGVSCNTCIEYKGMAVACNPTCEDHCKCYGETCAGSGRYFTIKIPFNN